MVHAFPKLFSPIRIGKFTLRNRIVNSGHGAHFHSGDGTPTSRYVDYVRERAKGGAGMIVVGHTVVHRDGEISMGMANFDDRIIPWYERFAAASHEFGTPILVQLGHRGRTAIDAAAFLGRPLMGASAVPTPDFGTPQIVPHAMTTEEVEQVIASFGAAASRVAAGGMDGVELASGMNYLFAQFLSPQSNRRTDRFGGESLTQRATFLLEVVGVVRKALGPDRLLGVRMYDDQVDYSLKIEDLKQIAPLLERTGNVDYLNVWCGATGDPRSNRMHYAPYYYEPKHFSYLAAGVKSTVKLPVIGAGRIDGPAVAEKLLSDGDMDLVGMVKALIADPHLPNKVLSGRSEEVRNCIGCTQSCAGHIYLGMGVGCIYNPVTGREHEWSELNRAARPGKVVVIGGGPAGMETARTAAERGHKVVLFEKERRLGGQINLISKTPARQSFEEIINFFARQLERLQVEVHLGKVADVDTVLAEKADAIVVATGSTPYRPEISGADGPYVFDTWTAISQPSKLGNKVVVVDTQGRPEGASVAEFLADEGKQVEVVTGLTVVGRDINPIIWHHMMERLLTKGVRLTPHTGVFEISDRSLTTYNTITWQPGDIEDIDSVVFASGGMANDSLFAQLKCRHPNVVAVGDCYQPRDVEIAVFDGHRVARELLSNPN